MLCRNCGKEIAEGSLFCSSCGSKVIPENICPKCGNAYPEGSVFCNACGQRVDIKGYCPSCGKPIQADAVYCNHCGKRLDGRERCSNCGELFEGFFCPKCGTPANKNVVASSSEKKKTDKVKLNEKLNKIFDKTGSSILLAGVVFALIFVFLIGFKVTINFSQNSYLVEDILDELNVQDKLDMYYYFGDVYKEIDELIKSSGIRELPLEYTSPALYFEAILGTVISAASILAVAVLAGFAIFTLVKKLRGKETKHAEKFAVATMLTYVLGAISLYALNYAKGKISVSNSENSMFANVQLDLNAASIAGIVLVSIALGLAFICYVLKNRSAYKKVETLVPSGLGLISSVFAVIVAAFATSGVFKFISKLINAEFYNMKVVSSIQMAGHVNLLTWAEQLQLDPNLDITPYIILIVLTILQFVLLTLAIVSIIKQCTSLMKNEKKNCWAINIALAVVSVVYFALAVTSKNELLNLTKLGDGQTDLLVHWMGEGSNKISVAPAIIAFVFAFLTLATSIAQKVIWVIFPKVEERKEEKVEEVNA